MAKHSVNILYKHRKGKREKKKKTAQEYRVAGNKHSLSLSNRFQEKVGREWRKGKKIGSQAWDFRNTEQDRFFPNPNWRTVDLIGIHLADKRKQGVVGRQGRPLGGCEHGVALPNAQGRITSKDKPWELAGQIAAGRRTEGEGAAVRECRERLSEQSHLYFRRLNCL